MLLALYDGFHLHHYYIIINIIIIAVFFFSLVIFPGDVHVCLLCVWCDLVRFVAARGSLLCERMPVFHFFPFVFETLEPVSESLSARVDAQLHATWRHRPRTEDGVRT